MSAAANAPLLPVYPYLRRVMLAELRAARRDYRQGRATFGEVWRATKAAVAVRHYAGLGYFPPTT